MIISTKQYAQALFEVSQEQNVVMDVYAELQAVSLILEDEKINRIFTRTYQDETILDHYFSIIVSKISIRPTDFEIFSSSLTYDPYATMIPIATDKL